MIERFEVGKSYRWIGEKTRPEGWAIKGAMDILLDGKGDKKGALFVLRIL